MLIQRRRILASALSLVASATLFGISRLVVLPQDPFGSGLGPSQTTPTLTAFAAVAVAGAVLVFRSPLAGAVLLGAITGALVVLVSVEFRPSVYLLALPTGLAAVAAWAAARPRRPALIGSIAATLLLTAGVSVAAWQVYQDAHGPTHPESTATAPEWLAEWMWVGGVTSDSATITAGGLDRGPHMLRYWSDEGPAGTASSVADSEGVARFELEDLSPGMRFSYELLPDDSLERSPLAESSFRTPTGGAQDLTVVLGACARTGANGAVFDRMLAERPDLYIGVGDLHYTNLVSDDPGDHIDALSRSLSTPAQSALVSSVPTTWVWDDHDYGDNDSDASSPSRQAASIAYRRAVPHYGVDPDPATSIAQAFTVGRVRFVVTDTRSMRTEQSMLGRAQLEWFLGELASSSESHALVVWVNPTPWISAAGDGSDDWSAYSDERQRIADHLAAEEISNLVMVSGDAHMVALDDGTNSAYADGGGFPVLHVGALDRPGSLKGGPFSHGSFPGGGQYGKLEIDDDGGPVVRVRLSGHTWEGQELTAIELELDGRDRGRDLRP